MKVSYILQMKDLTIMLFAGIFVGIIYGILNSINAYKKHYILQAIIDILAAIIAIVGFIVLVNIINWGEIRAFHIVAYISGFIVERITLGKLFAKGYKYVYTKLVRIANIFRCSRLGKVIFK